MSAYPGPHYSNQTYGPFGYAGTPVAIPTDVVTRFFTAVYGWMGAGLAVTAMTAWVVAHNDAILRAVFGTGLVWILFIALLIMVFTISAAINRIGPTAATALFIAYAALNGVVLAPIVLVYTGAHITAAFAATAGMFGAMTVVGFLTRRDLSSLGSILFMALIGLIIASVVNIFWANSTLYWIVTYAGVLIFCGLTAYDTNRLKHIAAATAGDPRMASRMAVVGSLSLYLNFLNLFLFMLRILGGRRQQGGWRHGSQRP